MYPNKMHILHKYVFKMVCVFLLIFLASCVNYGSEKHFENDPQVIAVVENSVNQPGRATVFLFRQGPYLKPLILTPSEPLLFEVDGKMISAMPAGSYVPLSLEPGRHNFTSFTIPKGKFSLDNIKTDRLEVDLVAGTSYYIGMENAVVALRFRTVETKRGKEIVSSSDLAKLIHQPIATGAFITNLLKERQYALAEVTARPYETRQDRGFSSESVRNALPSAQQVGKFLEGVATVALFAVLIFGIAAGASTTSAYASTPTLLDRPPTQLIAPAPMSSPLHGIPELPQNWQVSASSLSSILNSQKPTTLINSSTGIRYQIEDGRISGTDGSRYRVVGSNVYSDTGQAYHVVGNNIIASDGRRCVKTGTLISCR